jgi:hypothetical protein
MVKLTTSVRPLANQLRVWFASMAYVMVEATRRLALLQATDLAGATSAGSNSHGLGLSL